ncbi:cysteine--tRNA ligase [bacterium]|nr:cysteine--tRNA ligase [bacterium]
MSLYIYNTLSKDKEEFVPATPGKVGMYVCGVTVYDECHLGHARAVITFDMVYRYLLHKGFDVNYVRNFTDVDDKIINKAIKEGSDWKEVAKRYIAAFYRDMDALGNKRPSVEPKATEHIAEMQQLIETLISKKMAYAGGSDVFYAVREKKDYGKLSGKKIDELESGARIEIDEKKKDPLDFALWKGVKPGEPHWDSPWGKGRPGWHIECSAMSIKYLGESFDIHGGGRDLMFPHHENEIAQSEGATGKKFARYWIHNGFININSEKMSKSLGNFLTIHKLLKTLHPEVIRLFILAAHYRSPLDYTEDNIEATRQSLLRWYTGLARIQTIPQSAKRVAVPALDELNQKLSTGFTEAMDDDFNTARVLGLLFEAIREWNRILDEKKIPSEKTCADFLNVVQTVHQVLGIFGSNAVAFLLGENIKALATKGITEDWINQKINERLEARKNKDWAKSDAIRDELAAKGIVLKDGAGGTTWSVE